MALDSRCLLLLGLLPLSPGVMAEDESPDLALLEFLGSWEDTDGEWVDPLQLFDALQAEEAERTPLRVTDTEVEEDD